MQTEDYLTESCYHFHYYELTLVTFSSKYFKILFQRKIFFLPKVSVTSCVAKFRKNCFHFSQALQFLVSFMLCTVIGQYVIKLTTSHNFFVSFLVSDTVVVICLTKIFTTASHVPISNLG